jgi:hypothetical protein
LLRDVSSLPDLTELNKEGHDWWSVYTTRAITP